MKKCTSPIENEGVPFLILERGGAMPRTARRESATGFYHVILKGINKEYIFNQIREKNYFKSIILKQLGKCQVKIYAYCIMSNHAHFIIRADIHGLSAFMSKILTEYAVYYNLKHKRNGHVFQNRFSSEVIENSNYYWTCLRYIHMNPVNAKMIKHPASYRFSSMRGYKYEDDELLSDDALQMFKEKFESYRQFEKYHVNNLDKEIFLDLKEDVWLQQINVGKLLVEKIKQEYQLPFSCQVFEEVKYREMLEEIVREEMSLSKTKVRKLCNTLQNIYEIV